MNGRKNIDEDVAPRRDSWGERSLKAAAAGAGVAAIFLVFWYGVEILLLVFAGALLSVLLGGLAGLVHERTRLGYRWAFGLVVVVLTGLLALMIWLFATRIASEADRLAQELPRAGRELVEPLKQYEWIRRLLDDAPPPERLIRDQPEVMSTATGFVSSTFSAATALFVVLFLGMYIGFDPGLYRKGILRLVPPSHRHRATQVLDRLGHTLRWWLVAHFSSMAVVGVLTGIGLTLLGIPLAFILAVIAALLAFIPNVGPVLSAVPAILLALSQSPRQALYVALLYIGVQAVESNLITPVFELKAISLPPALTISVQLLLGSLVGVLGLLVASPLCASAMVLVQMLYIEDKLSESVAETES